MAGTDKTNQGEIMKGRYPSNFLITNETAELLDKQSGYTQSCKSFRGAGGGGDKVKQLNYRKNSLRGYTDKGGASRFFKNIDTIDLLDDI